MSNADWYRRQLGPSTAPVRRPDFVPVAPTRFVIGDDGRAYPVAQEYDTPPEQQPQYQAPTQPWRQAPGPGEAPIGQMHAMDAAARWKGTRESQQVVSGRCPECGSPNYMPRIGTRMGHCFACGYRPDAGDDRGGPSIQPRVSGGVSADGRPIPVEQARGVSNQFGGMVSGRLSQADLIGRAQ